MSKTVTCWEEEKGTLLLVSLKRSVQGTPVRMILLAIKWNVLLLSNLFKVFVAGRRKKKRVKLRLEMESPLGCSSLHYSLLRKILFFAIYTLTWRKTTWPALDCGANPTRCCEYCTRFMLFTRRNMQKVMYNFLIGPAGLFDLQHELISFLCHKCMYMHSKEKKLYIWCTDIQKTIG